MSYIFLLISLILIFVNIYLGFALSIVSLVISIIKFKKKDFLNTVTLILSSIVIITCIIYILTKNVETAREAIDESKKNHYLNYEQKLESLAKKYVYEDQTLNHMTYTGISYIQLNKLEPDNSNGCDGYVMFNWDVNKYKAYIKCSDYETEGYDASKDK